MANKELVQDLSNHLIYEAFPGSFVRSTCIMSESPSNKILAEYMKKLTYAVTQTGARPFKLYGPSLIRDEYRIVLFGVTPEH